MQKLSHGPKSSFITRESPCLSKFLKYNKRKNNQKLNTINKKKSDGIKKINNIEVVGSYCKLF